MTLVECFNYLHQTTSDLPRQRAAWSHDGLEAAVCGCILILIYICFQCLVPAALAELTWILGTFKMFFESAGVLQCGAGTRDFLGTDNHVLKLSALAAQGGKTEAFSPS
jgi:hypothetical protein